MPKKIIITIDGEKVVCQPNEKIIKAAAKIGIEIPGLCGHPDLPVKAVCRVCVVEIKGRPKLTTACSEEVENGMVISTQSERVKKARRLNLELIFAEHVEKCPTCVWNSNCKLLQYAEKYKIKINRFKDRKQKRKTYRFANAVELDASQCIDCRNCVDACSQMQKINYLEIEKKGINQEVAPVKDPNTDCIYCGQCTVHCPVSAAQEQLSLGSVENILKNRGDKTLVALFAPSIRVSIGEEFGLAPGRVVTGQLVTALKNSGFDYVFDVIHGADITTMVEARELVERLSERKPNSNLPMITSCCPAWVKYAEFYHPEILPLLTTARSPQIHLGGAIKTFWAGKTGIDPKKIVTVSIMPCTAKKYESVRKELRVNGLNPVDIVLTTREFAHLLRRQNIGLAKLKSSAADNISAESAGAGTIYGASGGVMESALRSAAALICKGDKVCDRRIDFKEVRGWAGVKEAKIELGKNELRVAVVNGIGNIDPVLKNLKSYDYIEVMACPDGCIGGGGQPVPTSAEIRKKRAEALYAIDKKSPLRKAQENKGAKEILKWLKLNAKLEARVLYTKYIKRS